MADLKTQPNQGSIASFIDSIEPESKHEDAKTLLKLIQDISGEQPTMWGATILGYGNYHYKYESGREGDWFLAGFSPRKQNLSIYINGGFEGQEELLEKLGKHKKSVGCLYVKRLSDIDLRVLEEMIKQSIQTLKKRYAEFN